MDYADIVKMLDGALAMYKAHGMPRSQHKYTARHPRTGGGYWYEYADAHGNRMVHHRDGDHLPIRAEHKMEDVAELAGVRLGNNAWSPKDRMTSMAKLSDEDARRMADAYEASDVKPHSVKEIGDAMAREVESIEHWRKFAFSGEGQDAITTEKTNAKALREKIGLGIASFRRLTGIPDGLPIRTSLTGNGDIRIRNSDNGSVIAILNRVTSVRTKHADPRDRPTIEIEDCSLDTLVSGRNVGLKMVLTQAMEARRLEKSIGRTTIRANAAGNIHELNSEVSTNGYITWLLIGFRSIHDGKSKLADFKNRLPGKIADQPIEQLVHSPEGRAWWMLHGVGFRAEFDPWDRYCISALSAEVARRLRPSEKASKA